MIQLLVRWARKLWVPLCHFALSFLQGPDGLASLAIYFTFLLCGLFAPLASILQKNKFLSTPLSGLSFFSFLFFFTFLFFFKSSPSQQIFIVLGAPGLDALIIGALDSPRCRADTADEYRGCHQGC